MAAAAKAIFEDMTERGILQQVRMEGGECSTAREGRGTASGIWHCSNTAWCMAAVHGKLGANRVANLAAAAHCSVVRLPQLVQEEEVGEYVAPEQQEAQRHGAAAQAGSSSARAARRQGQYDADAGRQDAGAESYRAGATGSTSNAANGAGGEPAEGQQQAGAARGSSAINKQSSHRGGEHGRLWEGTSGGAAHADAAAEAPAGPAAEGTDGQPGAGFQHFSMKQHKQAAGRGGKQAEEDGEEGASPGRQVGCKLAWWVWFGRHHN